IDFKKKGPVEAPSKPLKGAFDGFDGDRPGHIQKIDPPFDGFDGQYPGPFSKNSIPQIEAWRAAVEAIPAPCNHNGERLLNASLSFLASENATLLLSCGWDEIALFGVHRGIAPRERLDAWGLVTTLAWSTLSLTIKEVAAGHCVLTSQNVQGGSQLVFRRHKAGLANAVPWWRHPALIGDVS
ncbi:MAG: hypothetical protein WBX25_33810, partial [Rhodomicrobium sp.]